MSLIFNYTATSLHETETMMTISTQSVEEMLGSSQSGSHVPFTGNDYPSSTNSYFDDQSFFNISWSEEMQNKYYNINNDKGDFTTEMGVDLIADPTVVSIVLSYFGSLGWGDLALLVIFCTIISGTIAGNTLVILAVLTTRRLRTVTNCFVMSLAVADWLVGVFVMPPKVALYLVNNEWKLGGFICELWISLDVLLCTASILSLCAISIDRYLAITRPLAYSRKRRSKKLALSMIACVWTTAVLITSPPIFGWYEEGRNNVNKCEYNENIGYVVYSALGSFFLPLLVMLYVYARIACVIARRQHSIQKLHSITDRRSQCCLGSDAEEPLHQGELERGEVDPNAAIVTEIPKYSATAAECSLENRPRHSIPEKCTSGIATGSAGNSDTNKDGPRRNFWHRLRLKSCTKGNSDSPTGIATKRSGGGNGGQKSGTVSSDSESNSGIAISLPDPATLSGSVGGGLGGNAIGTGTGGTDNCSARSVSSSPGNLSQNQHHYHHHVPQQNQPHGHIQPSARMRTGSRLCHHSVATTSPQRNIHRVHQTASSTTRLFVENEVVPLEASRGLKLSKSTPRVWTVEETASPGLNTGRPKSSSPKGRATSFKADRHSRSNSRFNGTSSTLNVPMNNSPAGNPASLMSSPNVSNSVGRAASCDNSSSSVRISNRIYHPQPNHYHNHHHHNSTQNNVHRGRSVRKLAVNIHHGGNDHNQNGGSIVREFTSGRVASFKRETKTAQTLAAVVGGFIICWLPFFVAYVIGPFLPNSAIPSGLMDALIWLGWSNSTINPFIYAFYSPDFRNAFWRLTVKKCSNLFSRHRNDARRSPRRFDDHNNTHSRVSG